jgi:high-affinity iron transporter
MFGSALVVFREVLEAALVVAVVLGASRGVYHRGYWVIAGIVVGVAGAGIVAAFADVISSALEGTGQEIFNASVLLAAVAMLGWHNIWMSTHGRKIAQEIAQVGRAVHVGTKPLSALMAVTALAVLREGSETVLFLYGFVAGGAQAPDLMLGGLFGLAAGVALGWLLYRGLVIIPLRRLFSVTGWLILLLAAGLAANAAGYLTQAGLLPMLSAQVWDTSNLLSQQSWLGTLLHILIGYQDRPMGIQVVFYVTTIIVTLGLMAWVQRDTRAGSSRATEGSTVTATE